MGVGLVVAAAGSSAAVGHICAFVCHLTSGEDVKSGDCLSHAVHLRPRDTEEGTIAGQVVV